MIESFKVGLFVCGDDRRHVQSHVTFMLAAKMLPPLVHKWP